jgi:hypothetical protein
MFGLGWKIAAGFGFITVILGGISYFGYQYMSQQIELLEQNVAQQQEVIENQKRTNQLMRDNFASMQRRQNELTQQFSDIEQNTSQLRRLFGEHDFTNLVEEKPGLIEPRVNKGTDEVLMNLEDITDPSNYDTGTEQSDDEQTEE